jgi:DNA methylase
LTIVPLETVGLEGERLQRSLLPNFGFNGSRPRHRWFVFKEAFDADLVRYFIDLSGKDNGRILDPFCGSGTTLLEGTFCGWRAFGIETNPFMAFVARTKSFSPVDPDSLYRVAALASRSAPRTVKHVGRTTTLVERKGLDKWLFNQSVVSRFEILRAAIKQGNRGHERDIAFLALIAAMVECANARRDGKCWRYKREWRARHYGAKDLEIAFRTKIDDYGQDLARSASLPGKVSIVNGDARRANSWRHIPADIDLIVSSPPYLNSFDYTDIYRPEMLLMGGFEDSEDLRRIRFKTVRSHVQVDWPVPRRSGILVAQRAAKRLVDTSLWNRRIAEMINAYFVDLDDVFGAAAARLRIGGLMAIVVADSAYDGYVVRVGEGVAEILSRIGLRVEEVRTLRTLRGNGYHQRRGGRRLAEQVVIARRI